MKKQKRDKNRLASSVVVYAYESERVTLFVHAPQAIRLLNSGRAKVYDRNRHGIYAIQLIEAAVDMAALDARPGSFGIVREHLESGNTVFAHQRNTYGALARTRAA